MTREDVLPVKRKPLTKLEFARLAVEQNGKCAKCGAKLVFKPHQIRDEHLISLFGGGGNELENRQLWCVPCTKPKDAEDTTRHAKIKRIRGQTKTGPKKKIPKPPISPLSSKHPNYRKQKWGKS